MINPAHIITRLFTLMLFACALASSAQITINPGGGGAKKKTVKVKQMKVLMVGNSYSAYNSLSSLMAYMGEQSKPQLALGLRSYLAGGMTLANHLKNEKLLEDLKQNKYDCILLQDQSMLPLLKPELLTQSVAKFRELAPKTRIVLFVTWARKNKIDTTKTIYEVYRAAARASNCELAPVGVAMMRGKAALPKIELYANDGSHPSAHGSYLAASVLYRHITRKTFYGLKFSGLKTVSQAEAKSLRTLAASTLSVMATHEKKRQVAEALAAKKLAAEKKANGTTDAKKTPEKKTIKEKI